MTGFARGQRLGPYEILGLLGAGGMGEVYRARDPRMGREVAIKVSAERFSDRFDREVRAVAALNHPNVCHIYDVGPNFTFQDPSSLWLTQSANGALVYQCTDHQDSGQLDL